MSIHEWIALVMTVVTVPAILGTVAEFIIEARKF